MALGGAKVGVTDIFGASSCVDFESSFKETSVSVSQAFLVYLGGGVLICGPTSVKALRRHDNSGNLTADALKNSFSDVCAW